MKKRCLTSLKSKWERPERAGKSAKGAGEGGVTVKARERDSEG